MLCSLCQDILIRTHFPPQVNELGGGQERNTVPYSERCAYGLCDSLSPVCICVCVCTVCICGRYVREGMCLLQRHVYTVHAWVHVLRVCICA